LREGEWRPPPKCSSRWAAKQPNNELKLRVVYGTMRTVLSVVAVIAVLVGVAFVLAGCPKEQPPEGATPVSNEPAGVVAPEEAEVADEATVEEGEEETEEGTEGEEASEEIEEDVTEGEEAEAEETTAEEGEEETTTKEEPE
jgi:cytoskeletal protein RodZ